VNSPDRPTDSQRRVSLAYWTEETARCPESAGVAGIGGAGMAEILYRHNEELAHLLRIVSFTHEKAVVELGCGTGRWMVSLAGRVKHYTGVDFSRSALAVAARRASDLRLTNVTLQEGSASDFDPVEPIDIWYLSGVSQYLNDADLVDLLKRLVPKLAPGGVVVDRSTLHRRTRTITDNSTYFSIYRTGAELLRLFAQAGLVCTYQQPSYVFLAFPFPVRLGLRTKLAQRLVQATAPGSYAILRRLATLSARLLGPSGNAVDFTHDFFLFQRRAEISTPSCAASVDLPGA
jgi:SAM-dependent methyltransferase